MIRRTNLITLSEFERLIKERKYERIGYLKMGKCDGTGEVSYTFKISYQGREYWAEQPDNSIETIGIVIRLLQRIELCMSSTELPQ